jgi:uncharacterized protein (TIGR03084 family)
MLSVMPETLAPLLADLAAEQSALDAVVGELAPEQWDTPTPAPGWAVRHEIAHLTYFDEQAALAATDPDAYEAARDAMLADLGTIDTAGAYASLPAAELLTRWRSGRGSLASAFAPLDPRARLPWYGPPMSARSAVTARLMECWAHGVDVTDAFGLPPSSSDRLRHVAHLGFVTRGWSYAVRGREAPDVGVGVVLDPPSGGDQWVWGEADAEQRVEGPALDFCLVVTQRRPIESSSLTVVGAAAEEWLAIAQAFAGAATETTRV